MFNIIIKTVVIYGIIILVTRLMGKKQAGQLQPYEFVITLMIAEVASTPMDGPGIPVFYGLVPALTLLLVYFIFTFASLKSMRLRRMLCGAPSILIHNGKILRKELVKMNYSLTELLEQLRLYGNTDISSIHYAILETNGQLSVLPYASSCPATPRDLDIEVEEESMCTAVVLDGVINRDGASQLGMNDKEVKKLLHTLGFSRLKEILVCTISDRGSVFLQDTSGSTRSVSLPRGIISPSVPKEEKE